MFSAALKSPSLVIYTMALNVYARHFSSLYPGGETICFQISRDGVLRWSGSATLSLSKEKTGVSLFCSGSGNIVFITPACTSRRIAEYELKAYLFYNMLLPSRG